MITRKETQALLYVIQSTVGRILKAMVDNGQIKQMNRGRTTQYCVYIKQRVQSPGCKARWGD